MFVSPGDEQGGRTGDPASLPNALALSSIGLFGGLEDAALEQLARTLVVVVADTHQLLFSEGDEARVLFVVLEGTLEMTRRSSGGAVRKLATLGPGDWCGEMALIDMLPRAVTVKAVTPCRLLRLGPTDLNSLYRRHIKSYALLVMNMARELSRHLRAAEAELAEAGFADVDLHAGKR
jgi:CRP-like cAMP-binding protein